MEITGKYAASNIIVRQGMVLDTDKRCYYTTQKFLSFIKTKSACKSLPKLEYILMFKTLYAKCEPCEVGDFNDSSMVQLSLVYNKNRRLIIHESRNLTEIKELAAKLSAAFRLKIRDSASNRRKPVWIAATAAIG